MKSTEKTDEKVFESIVSRHRDGVEAVFGRRKRLDYECSMKKYLVRLNEDDMDNESREAVLKVLCKICCLCYFVNRYKYSPKKIPRWDEETLRRNMDLCNLDEQIKNDILKSCGFHVSDSEVVGYHIQLAE